MDSEVLSMPLIYILKHLQILISPRPPQARHFSFCPFAFLGHNFSHVVVCNPLRLFPALVWKRLFFFSYFIILCSLLCAFSSKIYLSFNFVNVFLLPFFPVLFLCYLSLSFRPCTEGLSVPPPQAWQQHGLHSRWYRTTFFNHQSTKVQNL